MTRRRLLAVSLGLSLALHGLALLWAPPFQTNRQALKKSYRQKVIVRMVERPAKANLATRPAAPKAATKSTVKTPTPSHETAASPKADAPSHYGDLLPGLGNLPLDAVGGGTAQPFAPPSQAASTVADELSGKLDIPLFFREQGDNVTASVKLELKNDSPTGWWFVYIAGNPLLRAVLYEALRNQENATAVQDLFRELNTHELLISLRQHTVRQPDPHDHFTETVRLEGTKLIIERTLYFAPPVPDANSGGGGFAISLPDREAERAKLRDRMRLERLTLSPAYISPLRERYP